MKKIPIRQIRSASQEPFSERFNIRLVEDLVGENNMVQNLHRHDFFFMLAIASGSGSHEIDFTTYEISSSAVFLLRPGQIHQLALKAGSTGYLIEFNTEFYHPKDKLSTQRFRKAGNKNYCPLEIKRFQKLHNILTYVFQEFTGREEGYLEVIKANLDIFFIEFVRQSNDPKSLSTNVHHYTQERFEEFLELLQNHITTHKQVSQYTDLLSLSSYQLNEITKATTGKTASALINEQIILEAKRYLLATPNQIKDIADHLGYEDVSYFIRFFKKQTGYSPEAFRHNF